MEKKIISNEFSRTWNPQIMNLIMNTFVKGTNDFSYEIIKLKSYKKSREF